MIMFLDNGRGEQSSNPEYCHPRLFAFIYTIGKNLKKKKKNKQKKN